MAAPPSGGGLPARSLCGCVDAGRHLALTVAATKLSIQLIVAMPSIDFAYYRWSAGIRAEPEEGLGGLDGLGDHGQQLAVERVQVDLVAQADREGVHRAGGVVAAPVEAPVDQVLD